MVLRRWSRRMRKSEEQKQAARGRGSQRLRRPWVSRGSKWNRRPDSCRRIREACRAWPRLRGSGVRQAVEPVHSNAATPYRASAVYGQADRERMTCRPSQNGGEYHTAIKRRTLDHGPALAASSLSVQDDSAFGYSRETSEVMRSDHVGGILRRKWNSAQERRLPRCPDRLLSNRAKR